MHKTYHVWEAAGGRSATTQVLGGTRPFEIVTNEASLNLFGPNTGFRDRNGEDALRNLSTSARLLVGNRDFTTAGSFTTTSRLTVFGGTEFTVNGDLTVGGGYFQLSTLSAYAREGEVGFPVDPEFISSNVFVQGNFNLTTEGALRFDFFDPTLSATLTLNGTAMLAGLLQIGVDDVSQISGSESFTVLTAAQITGQFSNVANGGRVDAFGSYDSLGNPLGDPVGTFLVTYGGTTLVLSDFQPTPHALSHVARTRAFGDQ